ncbi:MAG: DUF4476 domain-containing protein [Bacteroidaceae bacterium]|nr:DUF4476 domain-containing protein [Bacteroidaceae bacterium]
MKRRTIIGMAVAALLLCTTNGNAQSRVVRRANPERDFDRRVIVTDRHIDLKPVAIGPKIIGNDAVRSFKNEPFDKNRLRMAEMIFRTDGAVTARQAILIAETFSFDSNRLEFLKMAYPNCVDRHNYYLTLRTLDFNASRERLMDFINGFEAENPLRIINRITNDDMKEIVSTLKNETFDSTRYKLAVMILNGGEFTARQIAAMAKTFDFDNNRMDFLLGAYRFCIDRYNYTVAVNTLDFSSNRTRLMNEIALRP